MRIGTICVGHMGETVARHWAKLGHDVRIANSRSPGTLTATGKNRVVVLARGNSARKVAEVFHGFVGLLKNRSGLS